MNDTLYLLIVSVYFLLPVAAIHYRREPGIYRFIWIAWSAAVAFGLAWWLTGGADALTALPPPEVKEITRTCSLEQQAGFVYQDRIRNAGRDNTLSGRRS